MSSLSKVPGMAGFDKELGTKVKQLANEKLAHIVAVFERTLGVANTTIQFGEAHGWSSGPLGEEFLGHGLVMQFSGNPHQAVLLLGNAGKYLPTWFTKPDPSQQKLLEELALELGMCLLPEEWEVTKCHAASSNDLDTALEAAGITNHTGCLPFTLKSNDGKCSGLMVFPVSDATQIFTAGTPAIQAAAQAKPERVPQAAPPPPVPAEPLHTYNRLPKYTRSLLKIDVPLRVVLAEKKQSLANIMELGPGSIIQFTKSCEDMLELHVENQVVAQGEAVKVGDKFGLRIINMVLPEERFLALKATTAS